MKDAVTILVGAGAVLDFDHKGIFPSVKNITDEVLKQSIQKVDGGERPLLRELYNHVVDELKKVGRPEVNRYIPAYSGDSRSPIPMISVHSVGDLLYRRQS